MLFKLLLVVSFNSKGNLQTEDESIFSMGYGDYGGLGHGNNSNLSVPTKISKLTKVV